MLLCSFAFLPVQAYEQPYSVPALTGNPAVDIVTVAKSQVGYGEDASGGTAYGAWATQQSMLIGQLYDFTYTEWCCIFLCWCAEKAGIPRGIVFNTLSASPDILFTTLQLSGATITYDYSNYTPKCGDFVFYSYTGSHYNHVAITDGDDNYIHGNVGNEVIQLEGNSVLRLQDGTTYMPTCYVTPYYAQISNAEAADREPPVINEYGAINITNESFDLMVIASDNMSIARATVAVWNLDEGQDDITLEAAMVNGNTVTYTVNAADHNNAFGEYLVECTVYDPNGNSSTLRDFVVVIPPDDSEPPEISDVKITQNTHKGFTITAKVTDNIKAYKVKATAWTEENGADDVVWHEGTIKDGVATVRVPTEEHMNSYGKYLAQLYVYDYAENMTMHDNITVRVPTPDVTPPVVSNVRISEPTGVGFLFTASVSDENGISHATLDVVTETKDNKVSMQFPAEINGTALSCVTDNGNHLGEEVKYTVTLTVYDTNENRTAYETEYVPVVVKLSLGDVDGDGLVTEKDARLALLVSADQEYMTDAQITAGDIDKDGFVTAADARAMHRAAEEMATLDAA